MALTMREKQAVTRELAGRYARSNRRAKAAIISQVVYCFTEFGTKRASDMRSPLPAFRPSLGWPEIGSPVSG